MTAIQQITYPAIVFEAILVDKTGFEQSLKAEVEIY
jgi:hypothetical protein